jgi:hypothetical protein
MSGPYLVGLGTRFVAQLRHSLDAAHAANLVRAQRARLLMHSRANSGLVAHLRKNRRADGMQTAAAVADANDDDDDSEYGWVELPDLYAFVRLQAFGAIVHAVCGLYLLAQHPAFAHDFRRFDSYMPRLLRGTAPRWLCPEPHCACDRLLAGVKGWHRAAAAASTTTAAVNPQAHTRCCSGGNGPADAKCARRALAGEEGKLAIESPQRQQQQQWQQQQLETSNDSGAGGKGN